MRPFSRLKCFRRISTASQPWLQMIAQDRGEIAPLFRTVANQMKGIDGSKLTALQANLQSKDTPSFVSGWKQLLSSKYSSKSSQPVLLTSLDNTALCKDTATESLIADMVKLAVDELRQIWSWEFNQSPVCTYLLPFFMHEMAMANREDEALDILAQWDKKAEKTRQRITVAIAANAILFAKVRNPAREFSMENVLTRISSVNQFGLAPIVFGHLSSLSPQQLPIVLNQLVNSGAKLSEKGAVKFLRLVCSSSDAGGAAVAEAARKIQLPPACYQFVVHYLCRVKDWDTLDVVFNKFIPQMAAQPRSLGNVLHLIVLRTLATEQVHTTAEVLAKWTYKVPERTWMRIFQEFRYAGRPDKCNETLRQALQQHEKLRVPFIGEYLSFACQFYNLKVYGDIFNTLIPDSKPLLDQLGITQYMKEISLPTILEPEIILSADNCLKKVDTASIPESWLDITYRAVLNCIEDPNSIYKLYQLYAEYVIGRGVKVELNTVDQFVQRLVFLRTTDSINMAETILRDSLERLPIKKPSNGRHNCRSLEALCEAITHPVHGDVKRALSLVSDVFSNPVIAKRGRAIQPLLERLDPDQRAVVSQWATDLGAVV